MPSLYMLKYRFRGAIGPFIRALIGAGVTANMVTVASLALTIAWGVLLCLWPRESWVLIGLLPIVLLRMACNVIDGAIASEAGRHSRFGAIVNEMDVMADALLYTPLVLTLPGTPWLGLAAVLVALVAEYAGMVGLLTGAGRRYEGPMAKPDRAVVFAAIAVLAGFGVPLAGWLDWVWAALALLGVATVLNRLIAAYQEVPRGSAGTGSGPAGRF
ncbi:MAG: CDP-alcohol phosphatidyltransferase family protein [Azospirillaceae bacterium]